ncbi:uncharacterized protein LOC114758560 [Neltuma alba]|uniref:uncharacterized protein LOC114758560 n=1 Tax=Neltuma alba TaxID=207710 RepID=UPI0010A4B134|nr:uncharacterized protein LOC114758560 [Prosopis alba]
MYVTRPLSVFLKDEVALSLPPPEGPNSGYLVISDKESETLLRLRRDKYRIRRLPFFQNKDFIIDSLYADTRNNVLFVPVLDQPLSNNRYYVMLRDGWMDRGKAQTSLKEDDIECGGCCMPAAMPRPLNNPFDLYQQFEIIPKPRDRFQAKSIAPDGIPPMPLGEEWKAYVNMDTDRHPMSEASGLNSSLRSQLPHFNSLSSSDHHSEPVVVGKWYCPFMFVRDKGKKTTFYEMTLEQKWVRVFSKENDNSTAEKGVHVEVDVETEVAKIAGKKDAFRYQRNEACRFVWFIGFDRRRKEVVGLSRVIIERMKWEQERVGWVGGTNGAKKLVRVEEFKGNGTWRRFSCYLLVESFVLKRKDNSLVITRDFKHTHQVRCKWE